ncbi:MAG: hypothetical protein NC213_01880 [Acetobacter sp.]|nr:hypothetical protein [Bacteroides sp.]MCM1340474.1 hypothetical protein [Acetobacter sp.]MCM1433214.1 hypothetical protein [Clostridiales bacterium]
MKLIVDSKVLQQIWGASTEFWFSRTDYSIYNEVDLPSDDASKLFETGFIPFVSVSNEELIRAYVASLDNKKITAVLDKLNGEAYIETFWKYFNAYKEVSDGFDEFEKSYVINKLAEWCGDNSIEYKIAD